MDFIKNQQLDIFLKEAEKNDNLHDMREDTPSFKKYFMPPTEEIFTRKNKNSEIKIPPPPKEFILFGLNITDLEALFLLDEIMKTPPEDFFYFRLRKKSTVIGLINTESINNFKFPKAGDLIFQKTADNFYKIHINTEKGQKLIEKYKYLTKENDDSPLNSDTPPQKISKSENSKNQEWETEMKKLLLDAELLKNAVENSRDNKIWSELSEICLGCGICSYVCPLCYCFSNEDNVELNGKCSRCKKWTSCVLPEFSKISGGHNFRPTIKERYYNWFYHKFVRGYLEYGAAECSACERCKNYCPAKIDILEVLKKVIKEYKEIKN